MTHTLATLEDNLPIDLSAYGTEQLQAIIKALPEGKALELLKGLPKETIKKICIEGTKQELKTQLPALMPGVGVGAVAGYLVGNGIGGAVLGALIGGGVAYYINNRNTNA